jgi:hypothetical protein
MTIGLGGSVEHTDPLLIKKRNKVEKNKNLQVINAKY